MAYYTKVRLNQPNSKIFIRGDLMNYYSKKSIVFQQSNGLKLSISVLVLLLLTLLVSCNPSNTTATTNFNINGTFKLKYTVVKSDRKDPEVGSSVESEHLFSSNGTIVSAVDSSTSSVAMGPRNGNNISLSRTTSDNVKIDTAIALTSNDTLIGSITSNYPDNTTVVYVLSGKRKK